MGERTPLKTGDLSTNALISLNLPTRRSPLLTHALALDGSRYARRPPLPTHATPALAQSRYAAVMPLRPQQPL